MANLYRHMRSCEAPPASDVSDSASPSEDSPTTPRSPTLRPAVSQARARCVTVKDPVSPILSPAPSLAKSHSILPDPSWGPEPLTAEKRKRFAPPAELSLVVLQLVYVRDATLCEAIILAAAARSDKETAPSIEVLRYESSAGVALQPPAHAGASVGDHPMAWDLKVRECAQVGSVRLSQLPTTQACECSVARPRQIVANNNGHPPGDIAPISQSSDVVAGPEHTCPGPSHHTTLMPSSTGYSRLSLEVIGAEQASLLFGDADVDVTTLPHPHS